MAWAAVPDLISKFFSTNGKNQLTDTFANVFKSYDWTLQTMPGINSLCTRLCKCAFIMHFRMRQILFLRTLYIWSHVFIADLSTISHLNAKLIISTLETKQHVFHEPQIHIHFGHISFYKWYAFSKPSYTFLRRLCVFWCISDKPSVKDAY